MLGCPVRVWVLVAVGQNEIADHCLKMSNLLQSRFEAGGYYVFLPSIARCRVPTACIRVPLFPNPLSPDLFWPSEKGAEQFTFFTRK